MYRAAMAAAAAALLTAGTGRAEPASGLSGQALKKALAPINAVTGDDAVLEKSRELVKEPKRTRGLIAAAASPNAKPAKLLTYNGAQILGRAAVSLQEFKAAERLLTVCYGKALDLRSAEKLNAIAVELLFSLRLQIGDYKGAIKLCQELLEVAGSQENGREFRMAMVRTEPFIQENLAQALARSGKTDEALKVITRLTERAGLEWYFLRTKAYIQREAGKTEDALKSYLEARRQVRNRPQLKNDLREQLLDEINYALTAVYVDLGDVDEAADILKELIRKNPKNPTYYNDLGYIWADKGVNLAEAEKQIRKAVELDKERKKATGGKPEAAYLDSLGWVLYKQGKYKEAVKYLQEAVDQRPTRDVEITYHLADAYAKLGKTQKAVKYYKRALEEKNPDRRERRQQKEIREKLKKLGQAE